jgi:hypothetical protein
MEEAMTVGVAISNYLPNVAEQQANEKLPLLPLDLWIGMRRALTH